MGIKFRTGFLSTWNLANANYFSLPPGVRFPLMTYANNEKKLPYLLTLHSQKRLPCNFSLKYPYIIQQTVEENIQTHQVRFITLIEHLTLVINLQGNV